MEAIALLLNDIHVDKDNISEFDKNWDEALSICRQHGICDIVVGGDMFTSRSSQTLATLLAVRHALDRAVSQGIDVTIAEGNHDLVVQEEMEGYNHLFTGLKGVDIVDTHRAMYWEDCDFCLLVMSYFPEDGTFLERLEKAVTDTMRRYEQIKGRGQILLYIHEGVHGALGDFDIPGELPQEPLMDFMGVLCGHYHNRARIRGTKIEYIGSSRQHNFGEDEEKGYTILYDNGERQFVKNRANTRYATIEINAGDMETLEDNIREKIRDGYKTRVRVKCDEREAKTFDKKKLVEMGFNKVEVVSAQPAGIEITDSEICEKYDRMGIRKEYQSFCADRGIDAELGMKYLDKTEQPCGN